MKRIAIFPLFALAVLPLLSASASTGVNPDEFVLSTDLTDSFAGTVSGSPSHSNFPVSGAFDDDVSSTAGRWVGVLQSGDALAWLQWDFADGAHVVRAYSFMSHVETDESRAPRAWILEGSDDGGATWTTLDAVSGEPAWTKAEWRIYRFENERAFSSYRWTFTAGGGGGYLGLQEVELCAFWKPRGSITETLDPAADDFEAANALSLSPSRVVTASSAYSTFTGDKMFDGNWTTTDGRWLAIPAVIGNMPDLTDLFAGTVTGSPTHPDYTVSGAFDNDATTANGRWLGAVQDGAERAWLRWDFADGPQTVAGYGFKTVVSGDIGRAPTAWTLSGSNDGGETWTLLDSESGQAWKIGEERVYPVENPAAFSSYRFSFTANGWPDYVGLSEIEFYSPAAMAADAAGRAWVQLELPEAVRANGYKLHSLPTDSGTRCPTAWRLLASDDGATWTVLDRKSKQAAWGDSETRRFDFRDVGPFRFWRLVLDGGSQTLSDGYVALSELELFDYGSARVRCSPSYDNGSDRHCIGSKAFDGDLTTAAGEWMAVTQSGTEKAWISYRFDRKVRVDGYAFSAYAHATRATTRSPLAWKLFGSNDAGLTWTELDSRTRGAWYPSETRFYDVASPGRYDLYKFSISRVGSDGNYIGLQEIELYGSLSGGTIIVVR